MTYKIPTCFSAEAPSSENPKHEALQVPTQHSCYYSNRMLKTSQL